MTDKQQILTGVKQELRAIAAQSVFASDGPVADRAVQGLHKLTTAELAAIYSILNNPRRQ